VHCTMHLRYFATLWNGCGAVFSLPRTTTLLQRSLPHPHVSLQHMGCMFKPKSSDHGDSGEELTFLYRLMSGACPESYGLQVATMAGLPKSIVEKASVAGEMMRSKIARNFKSSEERVEFSTLHEEWFMAAIYVCGVEGQLDDDTMDPAFCISQELKAHFKKAG
jgi:DNA mismatch repair protein MSH6